MEVHHSVSCGRVKLNVPSQSFYTASTLSVSKVDKERVLLFLQPDYLCSANSSTCFPLSDTQAHPRSRSYSSFSAPYLLQQTLRCYKHFLKSYCLSSSRSYPMP